MGETKEGKKMCLVAFGENAKKDRCRRMLAEVHCSHSCKEVRMEGRQNDGREELNIAALQVACLQRARFWHYKISSSGQTGQRTLKATGSDAGNCNA
jgi:hypothetical protein